MTEQELVSECLILTQEIKRLREKRDELIAKLGKGRHTGPDKDLYITIPGGYYTYSIQLIRQYLTAEVMRRCRTWYKSDKPYCRVVPKLKPKKEKPNAGSSNS